MTIILAVALLAQPGLAALGSPRWADREAAVERLRAMPLEQFLVGLDSADPEVRRNVLRIIRTKDPCHLCSGSAIIGRWNYARDYEEGLCPTCDGYGSPWLKDRIMKREKLCPNCSGAGKQLWTEAMAAGGGTPGLHECPHCKGTGVR